MVWVAEITHGEPEWLGTVAREVRMALSLASLPPAYDAALTGALSTPGGILSGIASARWTRTVVTCCTSAGGRREQAMATPARYDLVSVRLDITERKSASLAAAACQIGALCGAGADLQARYGQFGACLGMVAQLSNDLAAVAPGTEDARDVALKRPTLPLAYAAQVPDFEERSDTGTRAPWTQGAAYLTWAVAESFRQSAVRLIRGLSDSTSARAELEDLLCTL